MSKEIILISTFCDTEEKIEILRKNILKIKNEGFDVAIISPINLPQNIVEKCDYTFFTKENPILDWPVHAMYNWKDIVIKGENFKFWQTYPDYGWSGLNHVKRLGEIFINYPYETYAFIIYDSILTENDFESIRKSHEGIVYPSKRGKEVWKVGLHLMIFNKDMLKRVIDKITLPAYLSYKDFDAFAFLHNHIVIPLQLEIAKEPIEDEVFYYEDVDILNHSIDENIKYFVSSPDEFIEEVRILFYEFNEPFDVILKVNEQEFLHTITEIDTISTELLKSEITSLILCYNGITHDLTEKLKSIKNNVITKL
jgi:hypothetical protein